MLFDKPLDDKLISQIHNYLSAILDFKVELLKGGSTLRLPNDYDYNPIKKLIFDKNGIITSYSNYKSGDEFYNDVINFEVNHSSQIIKLNAFLKQANLINESKNIRKENHTFISDGDEPEYDDDGVIRLPYCDFKFKNKRFGSGTRHDFMFGAKYNAGRLAYNEILNICGEMNDEDIFKLWFDYISKYHDGTSRDWLKTAKVHFKSLNNNYMPSKNKPSSIEKAINYLTSPPFSDLLSRDLEKLIPDLADRIYDHLRIEERYKRNKEIREIDDLDCIYILIYQYLGTIISITKEHQTGAIPLVLTKDSMNKLKKRYNLINTLRKISIEVREYMVNEVKLFPYKIRHSSEKHKKARFLINPRDCENIQKYLIEKISMHFKDRVLK